MKRRALIQAMMAAPASPRAVAQVELKTPPGVKPTDPLLQIGCLDVTKAPYFADPSGRKDSTAAIQRAVIEARDHRLVCFFPPGTYLISDTISCEQQVRRLDTPRFVEGGKRADYWHLDHRIVMIGSTKGRRRPVLKLSANAKGFDDPSKPKIAVYVWAHTWYGDGTGEQPNISFGHIFKGIDIDVRGHAGAIGIRHSGSQGSTLQDSTIHADGAYAGMNNCCGQGGGAHNLEVAGGQYGIVIEPNSRFPLLNACVFRGQTQAAIRYARGGSQAPTLLAGCLLEPAGECVVDFTTEKVYAGISLVDCVVAMRPGGVLCRTTKDENIFLEDTLVRGVERVRSGGPRLPSQDGWTRICRYSSHSGQGVNFVNGVQGSGEIIEWERTAGEPSYPAIRSRHYRRTPSFEDAGGVNVKTFGAKGDGVTDDTGAFEKAIARHDMVFVPRGSYRLSGVLRLRPNTHLFAFSREFAALGSVDAPRGPGRGPMKRQPSRWSRPTPPRPARDSGFPRCAGTSSGDRARGPACSPQACWPSRGTAGGRLCGVMAMRRPLVLQGIRQPAAFYALNVERVLSNPQSEISGCSHIRVYYFKVEAATLEQPGADDANTPCRISRSRDVRVYCQCGNVQRFKVRPMLKVADSEDIVVSQLKTFRPAEFPLLTETRGGVSQSVPSSRECALFVRDSEGAGRHPAGRAEKGGTG